MEHVMAVKASDVAHLLCARGLITERIGEALEIINTRHTFLPRGETEGDPSYKQIIPYVALLRGDEVFTTRRLTGGGEERLHGLISIGAGGHINDESDETESALKRGLERELREELEISAMSEPVLRGLINDDTNSVGSVHLGLLYTLEVAGAVRVRETEKLEGCWVKTAELQDLYGQMETWSQIALEIFK